MDTPISGDESYVGHISIPYLTAAGVVSMRYRKVTGEGPKYLSVHGDKGRPYNVGSLLKGDPIFITEGELDAVVLTQIGVAAVGLPGAATWRNVFSRLFRFRVVYVLQDGDDAGQQFGETVCKDIPGSKGIDMGAGRDVNSIYLDHGVSYLKEWIGLDE